MTIEDFLDELRPYYLDVLFETRGKEYGWDDLNPKGTLFIVKRIDGHRARYTVDLLPRDIEKASKQEGKELAEFIRSDADCAFEMLADEGKRGVVRT